jgi:hypothetical protein
VTHGLLLSTKRCSLMEIDPHGSRHGTNTCTSPNGKLQD